MKKLDRDEARLLASVERGDWNRPTTAAEDMVRLQAAAAEVGVICGMAGRVAAGYDQSVELDRSLSGVLMPVDILLVSEAEFEERANQTGTMERAARQEGRVLYEA